MVVLLVGVVWEIPRTPSVIWIVGIVIGIDRLGLSGDFKARVVIANIAPSAAGLEHQNDSQNELLQFRHFLVYTLLVF